MAVTASFNAPAGLLTEFGDALDNTITTSRNAAGNILVNGGAVGRQSRIRALVRDRSSPLKFGPPRTSAESVR